MHIRSLFKNKYAISWVKLHINAREIIIRLMMLFDLQRSTSINTAWWCSYFLHHQFTVICVWRTVICVHYDCRVSYTLYMYMFRLVLTATTRVYIYTHTHARARAHIYIYIYIYYMYYIYQNTSQVVINTESVCSHAWHSAKPLFRHMCQLSTATVVRIILIVVFAVVAVVVLTALSSRHVTRDVTWRHSTSLSSLQWLPSKWRCRNLVISMQAKNTFRTCGATQKAMNIYSTLP